MDCFLCRQICTCAMAEKKQANAPKDMCRFRPASKLLLRSDTLDGTSDSIKSKEMHQSGEGIKAQSKEMRVPSKEGQATVLLRPEDYDRWTKLIANHEVSTVQEKVMQKNQTLSKCSLEVIGKESSTKSLKAKNNANSLNLPHATSEIADKAKKADRKIWVNNRAILI